MRIRERHGLSGLSVQSVQRGGGGEFRKTALSTFLVLFYALYEWFAVHSINPRESRFRIRGDGNAPSCVWRPFQGLYAFVGGCISKGQVTAFGLGT